MFRVDIGGVTYNTFKDISVYRSMTNASGSFVVTVSAENNEPFPIQVQSSVQIYINGIQIINGYVDSINVSYASDFHTLTIQGRDITSDVIDSTVVKDYAFQAPITLDQICRRVLDDLGLTKINVINNLDETISFSKGELAAASVDENAFNFIEKYCRKKQVLLTTNGVGDLVLTRSSTDLLETALINKVSNLNNNILSASFNVDYSDRFNKYTVKSQSNFSSIQNDLNEADPENKTGESADRSVRETRQLTILQPESLTNNECKQSAQWVQNIRRTKSKEYSCQVASNQYDELGNPWFPNVLVKIQDDFCDIDAKMLLRDVELIQQANQSYTNLTFVPKDAFTLEAEKDAFDLSKEGQEFENATS